MGVRTTVVAVGGLVLALALATPSRGMAQVEVEVDPLAYALNGFSFHVAKVLGVTRLNVGMFGIEVPRFLHGNEGWGAQMRGAGLKWDYVGASPDGLFVGLEGGYMRTEYTVEASGERDALGVIAAGVRTGYRIPVGRSGLYVVPWMAVSYEFNGDDVVIGGERFERNRVSVYPLFHIGWSF